jgi:hypothetical protein
LLDPCFSIVDPFFNFDFSSFFFYPAASIFFAIQPFISFLFVFLSFLLQVDFSTFVFFFFCFSLQPVQHLSLSSTFFFLSSAHLFFFLISSLLLLHLFHFFLQWRRGRHGGAAGGARAEQGSGKNWARREGSNYGGRFAASFNDVVVVVHGQRIEELGTGQKHG